MKECLKSICSTLDVFCISNFITLLKKLSIVIDFSGTYKSRSQETLMLLFCSYWKDIFLFWSHSHFHDTVERWVFSTLISIIFNINKYSFLNLLQCICYLKMWQHYNLTSLNLWHLPVDDHRIYFCNQVRPLTYSLLSHWNAHKP